MHQQFFALVAAMLLAAVPARASGKYFEVTYPPSAKEGELSLGVTYTLWLPDHVQKVRGVIVHQHGCGEGACKGGATAAYDLHWQALAKKWDCALLGPSYHQSEKDNCRLWCDPRNGSHKTFLKSLDEFAAKSGHAELAKAPWCLWGHSGGGFWASLMQTMYPERIVAIWFRSGTAFVTWEKGEIPKPEIPAAAYGIPMMLNPGAKENGDPRFNGAWTGSLAMFKAYREKGAPVGFAPDPRTAHECGDSRYLAIPFFDACLALRLPAKNAVEQKLKPVDLGKGIFWTVARITPQEEDHSVFYGKVWLPTETVAKAWAEYRVTGATSDPTPPPAPFNLRVAAKAEGAELTWDAEADFESGLAGFVIERDGQELAKLPEKPVGRFGRALFQTMSYHDTPEKPKDGPLPAMRFVDTAAKAGAKHVYRVAALNSVGLKSAPVADNAAGAKRFLCCDYPGGQVCIVSAKGEIEWRATAKNPQDCWLLPNGNILFCHISGAVEMTRDNRVVWEYKAPEKVECHACQPLPDGRVMVVEGGTARIVEVGRDGKVTKEVKLPTTVTNLHNQFRGTRKTAKGTYLVCAKGESKVLEVDGTGKVLREIPVTGDPHEVLALPNGNLLITCGDGHKVVEVNPAGKTVWELNENDVPGNPLRLMAGAQRLPNGNTVFCNYLGHGHYAEQPMVFELTPDKKVVWQFDDHTRFRSVNQIQVLDVPGDATKGAVVR